MRHFMTFAGYHCTAITLPSKCVVAEHYPLRNRRGLRWLHAPEVLLWRLTGEQRTDITLASRTLCLDVRKGEWSAKAAALLHVPCSAFAPLVQPRTRRMGQRVALQNACSRNRSA